MRKGFLSSLSPKARRRVIGLAQDLVIIALTVSALLMAGSGGMLGLSEGLPAGVLGSQTEQGYGEQKGYTAAAEPLSMMLTPESGAHCGIMYSGQELQSAYERYSATLAEALGSSGEPEEISEEAWRSALNETGVFFDFYCDFQLSSLAIWLGTDISGSAAGHTARRICIYLDEGQVWLSYIRSRDSGGFYRCSTSVSASEFAARVDESLPNGAEYAFELSPSYDALDPYTVLVQGTIRLDMLSSENSLRYAGDEELFAAFGLNSLLASTYPESDGTQVSVEGEATLRLGFDGVLRYTNRSALEGSSPISPSDAVELTRRILAGSAGLESGVAELRLSYIYLDGSPGGNTPRNSSFRAAV